MQGLSNQIYSHIKYHNEGPDLHFVKDSEYHFLPSVFEAGGRITVLVT